MNSPFNNYGNPPEGQWQPSRRPGNPHTPKPSPAQQAKAWVPGKHIPSAATDPWSGLLPVGGYTAVITDCIYGENTNGNSFYRLVFQVVEGPHQGARTIRLLWLTPDGQNMASFFCELIGLTLETLGQVDPTGIHCWIETVHSRDECVKPASVVRRVRLIDMSGKGEYEEGGPHHG